MEWTMKDNMVNGLFCSATLTSRRRGHTHLCKQERSRLNWTHAVLVGAITGGLLLVSGMKLRSVVVLSNYSAFHRCSTQGDTFLWLSSDELMICCAAGTNGRLDLRKFSRSWLLRRLVSKVKPQQ